MAEKYTGKFTACPRRKPSVPMRWLEKHNLLVGYMLDYGCGRGYDAQHYGMQFVDPNWFPDVPFDNRDNIYDTIVCNYVLNVVTKEVQDFIISEIKRMLRPDGIAYITVTRHISEDTQGKGCVQRFIELDLPVLRKVTGHMVMYEMRKE